MWSQDSRPRVDAENSSNVKLLTKRTVDCPGHDFWNETLLRSFSKVFEHHK